MIAIQVMANDVAVTLAGASGNFELNVCKPLIAHAVLQSIRLLADGMRNFDKYCASGIEARRDRITEHLNRSLMLVTALVPAIGYDRAAEVAQRARAGNVTLREAALSLGYLSEEEFDIRMAAALSPVRR